MDASHQAVGGYSLETGWWWKYDLSEEGRSQIVRSRTRVGYDSPSISALEYFGMVWTAHAMIVIREELPGRGGFDKRGYASIFQRVLNCKGGKDDVWAGA